MDLSGIIFVALAVGWAGYLIPKALKHHDDVARTRPVETFSDSVRVVGASVTRTVVTAQPVAESEPVEPITAPEPAAATDVAAPAAAAPAPARPTARPAAPITRAAARRAARRRRRVLAGLLVVLAATVLTSYLAYTPGWSPAVPAALIVAFLVVARLTVRAQQVRRAAPVQPEAQQSAPAAAAAAQTPAPARSADAGAEADLGGEDTQGLSREELAAAVAAPVLDDGALWDPLPVTLPTYVNKARARRTVRTIEITGMTSSGHDPADSALAREAEEAAKAEAETQAAADEAEARRVAGA